MLCLNIITRQLENHDTLPGVATFKEVITFDLVIEFQFVYGNQICNILVRGVIEKQEKLPGIFIIRLQNSGHDLVKDFC